MRSMLPNRQPFTSISHSCTKPCSVYYTDVGPSPSQAAARARRPWHRPRRRAGACLHARARSPSSSPCSSAKRGPKLLERSRAQRATDRGRACTRPPRRDAARRCGGGRGGGGGRSRRVTPPASCPGRPLSSRRSCTSSRRRWPRSSGQPSRRARTSGWLCASAATAGATMRRNADWKADTRTTPAGWPAAMPATSASAASTPSSSVAAWRTSTRPASVSRTLRPLRSSSCAPGLALEHGELLGDRAGRVVERPGRAVDGPAGVELAQQA